MVRHQRWKLTVTGNDVNWSITSLEKAEFEKASGFPVKCIYIIGGASKQPTFLPSLFQFKGHSLLEGVAPGIRQAL